MVMTPIQRKIAEAHYRSIWISDIHLGTRGCKADHLLDFLRHTDSDYLYLVGDIVDGWRLKKSWYWPQAHNDVIQKLLRKARKGTKLIYVAGNHDDFLQSHIGRHFGGIDVVRDTVHVTADNRRLLVIHGDAFDGVVKYAKWLAVLGDWAYGVALTVNHWINITRRQFGGSRWSLSSFLKHKVKNAIRFIDNYEEAVSNEAKRRGVDGVVCGHIHKAEIREMNGVLYCNDGDWIDSCTALVEHADGRLELIYWAEERALLMLAAA